MDPKPQREDKKREADEKNIKEEIKKAKESIGGVKDEILLDAGSENVNLGSVPEKKVRPELGQEDSKGDAPLLVHHYLGADLE